MKTIIAVVFLLFTGAAQAQDHATLQQQKTCADQAKKAFESDHKKNNASTTQKYISHYDSKQNTCYLGVRTTIIMNDYTTSIVMTVRDAFEGREYAGYTMFGGERRPTACFTRPRGQKPIACTDQNEFEEAIDKHFGIAF